MSAYHLLDTNVIIRLFDKKDIAHEPCMKTIENLFSFGNEPCLTTQVLIEFWAVTTRNPENNGFGWSKLEVSRHIEGLLEQFTFLPENSDVFPVWKSLVLANDIKGKRVHDARLAAFMNVNGITRIITLNSNDFTGFGVEIFNPMDLLNY